MTRPARDEMSGKDADCISSLHLYALGLASQLPAYVVPSRSKASKAHTAES